MRGMWKGKTINFTPGRLMVGIKSSVNKESAMQKIEELGGRVDFISKNSIDIIVDSQSTLKVASMLEATNNFRFVTPEIL